MSTTTAASTGYADTSGCRREISGSDFSCRPAQRDTIVYLVSLPDVAEETRGYYFKRKCRELAARDDAAARGSTGAEGPDTGRRLSETERATAANRRPTWSKEDEVGRADHVTPGHRLGYI